MRKLLSWLLLPILSSCSPAFAQNVVSPCVTQTDTAGFSSCAPVTSSNALPVTVNSNATAGFVLTSNGSGASTFQASSGVPGTGTVNYVALWTPDGATLGTSLLYDNGTSVGIGTSSPADTLDIKTNASNIQMGTWSGASMYNAFFLDGTAASATTYNFLTNGADFYINRPLAAAIHFRENNGGDQLIIAAGGNVGIGTTTTTSLLNVGSAGQLAVDTSGDLTTLGAIQAGTGLECIDPAGNCIAELSASKTSGNGSGVQIRNGADGNIAYMAVDSWVNGGTKYHQLDIQAAQSDGIVCMSGGGNSCGLTIGSTNSIIIANASSHAGQTACYTTSGQMGYCTSTVGAGGACTCTGF